MNILKPLIFSSVVFILLSASISAPFKSKLERAFLALSVYNYFDAKDLFYKSLKKDRAPASYGLAVIYERNDNPFHNLDSAFKYISIADSIYTVLDSSYLLSYAELGASTENVDSLKVRVDSLFFDRAVELNEIDGWHSFLSEHFSEPYYSLALQELYALAFQQAENKDKSEAYRWFIQNYPDAHQVVEARQNLDRALFKENTRSGLLVDYQRFIREYPQSPFRKEAEEIVYNKFTEDGSLNAYIRFIEDNQQNSFVERAWKRIYALEIKELSSESIAAFTLKYPNYPFLDELQAEYDLVTTKFYPVFNGQKWGFIDERGTLKIGYKFEFVEPFRESIALIGIGDSTAYINKSGKIIHDGLFEDGYSFKRGFAIVQIQGNFGAINRLGEWIIKPEYEDVGEFSGGLFYLFNGAEYGYADQNGNMVIDFNYTDANDFMNGRAVVSVDGKYGLINTDGNFVSQVKYDWIDSFKDTGNPVRFRLGQKFGLLLGSGMELDSALYDQIGEFIEHKALFANKAKYGFLNAFGDTVIQPKYTYTPEAYSQSYFNKGYAKVFQNDKVAIIDSLGNKVFPAIFQDIGSFDGNLIPIRKKGKWGYADLDVNLAIPYQYEWAQNFIDSTAIVKKDGFYFLIDSIGNNVLDTMYKDLDYIGNHLIAADSLYGILDKSGVELVPMVYKSIEKLDNKVAKLSAPNGKIDYFNYHLNKFIWRQD